MTVKNQLVMLKENWLIIAIIVVGLFFVNIGGVSELSSISSVSMEALSYDGDYGESTRGFMPNPGYASSFAPEVEERKVIQSASLSTEVKRGTFREAEQQVKGIVTSTGSFILSENVYKQGSNRKEYLQGTYQLKVEVDKYDSIIPQLKSIGEVQHFSENTRDVTGQYVNNEINLETEKARLDRYREMYDEAEDIKDKLEVSDRIFNQERTVKYLEDALTKLDERIDYTTIQFTVSEKRSEYADIAFIKISFLVKRFVQSVNSLLSFISSIIPWALAVGVGWLVWRRMKK